ncbi:polyprenol monophosphomannose synthase [Rubripirellula amarantea]|nr:polyprenol monophosphomannose synthase [Rubripirellula amarantea]
MPNAATVADLAPPPTGRVLIGVCTLNEAANIESLLTHLRMALPDADILIVDDNSPDGTAAIANRSAEHDARIRVDVRTARGLGGAIRHAMQAAIDGDYEWFVNLDGDFSHNPADIPRLLDAATHQTTHSTKSGGRDVSSNAAATNDAVTINSATNRSVTNNSANSAASNQPADEQPTANGKPQREIDVVIGSRYVDGGSIVGWPLRRKIMSHLVNRFATLCLRLPVRDCSGSMRCYRVQKLKEAGADNLVSNGYSVLEEILIRLKQVKAHMIEVPITFTDRTLGESKLTSREAIRSMGQMVKLALKQ